MDDVCIFDCESIFDCMIKLLLALAYPSVCLLCIPYVWFSLLQWSSTWCEQMRGTPRVNREVTVSLLSLWTGFCFWTLPLGQWLMYYLAFGLYFENFVVFLYVFFWHCDVPWLLYGVILVFQNCITILFDVTFSFNLDY